IIIAHVRLFYGLCCGMQVKIQPPELKAFMDKKLSIELNARRHVTGVLRGFDQFMNLVLDAAVDEKAKVDLGMIVIRGNSIQTMEVLEPLDA
ncbi:hypothetical protein H632_c1157p0, partial [Helicosporidium sp. ATCC 50920]